jgi:hypothetical protein
VGLLEWRVEVKRKLKLVLMMMWKMECSSCGTLSGVAGVESGGEAKAEVGFDDDVEDGIDVGVEVNVGVELVLLLD